MNEKLEHAGSDEMDWLSEHKITVIAICLSVLFAFYYFLSGQFNPMFDHAGLLAVSDEGKKLVIYDTNNDRILITDRELKLENVIVHPWFYNIWGLSTNDSGEIIVPNSRASKTCFSEIERKRFAVTDILFFDLRGNLTGEFHWYGENALIVAPTDVLPLPDGSFMVADGRLDFIFKLDARGRLLKKFGGHGREPGKIHYPNDLLLDSNGNILEVDGYGSRLQLFNQDGEFLRVVAEKGTSEAQVMFPNYACMDKRGNIYVTELTTMRISIFDRNYNFKRIIDPRKAGVKKEKVALWGIAYTDAPERIYVLDTLNSSIYVFDIDGNLLWMANGVSR